MEQIQKLEEEQSLKMVVEQNVVAFQIEERNVGVVVAVDVVEEVVVVDIVVVVAFHSYLEGFVVVAYAMEFHAHVVVEKEIVEIVEGQIQSLVVEQNVVVFHIEEES
jgi:hypothetical protein